MNNIDISLEPSFRAIISVIAFLCAITILILTKKKKKTTWLVAGFFFIFSVQYLFTVFQFIKIIPNFNWKVLDAPIAYASSAFIYLFVQYSLRKDFKMKYHHLLIFIPCLLFSFAAIYYYVTGNLFAFTDSSAVFLSMQIFEIVLVVLNLQTIRWYKKNVLQTQSSFSKHQYSWVSFIVISLGVYSIYPIQLGVLSRFEIYSPPKDIKLIISVVLAIGFLLIVLIKTLINARNTIPISDTINDLQQLYKAHPENKSLKNNKGKDKKQLTQEEKEIFERIEYEFKVNKTYLDSEISINQLANILNESSRIISKVINNCGGQNFYDFINFYRINEAKRILSSDLDTKLTISEVMYSVGYNSKSTFNTAFKKNVGLTPSVYRKKCLEELNLTTGMKSI